MKNIATYLLMKKLKYADQGLKDAIIKLIDYFKKSLQG